MTVVSQSSAALELCPYLASAWHFTGGVSGSLPQTREPRTQASCQREPLRWFGLVFLATLARFIILIFSGFPPLTPLLPHIATGTEG